MNTIINILDYKYSYILKVSLSLINVMYAASRIHSERWRIRTGDPAVSTVWRDKEHKNK